ncbi:unnamed protein product, partial [marine sediment metagenome]
RAYQEQIRDQHKYGFRLAELKQHLDHQQNVQQWYK